MRSGSSLLEIMVALSLGATVGALGLRLVVSTFRTAETTGSQIRVAQELAHATAALTADLHGAATVDVSLSSSSSLELFAPVLGGVICERPSDGVLFVVSRGAIDPLTAVHRADPRTGDRLVWVAGDTAYTGGFSPVHDTSQRTAALVGATQSSGCTTSPLRGSAANVPWRIELAAGTIAPAVGSAVLVQRRTEWRLYQASGNEWYLGRNEWTGSGWGGIQPVAGPLAPSPVGALFALAPSGLDVTLRAPRIGLNPSVGQRVMPLDSMRVRIALRGTN